MCHWGCALTRFETRCPANVATGHGREAPRVPICVGRPPTTAKLQKGDAHCDANSTTFPSSPPLHCHGPRRGFLGRPPALTHETPPRAAGKRLAEGGEGGHPNDDSANQAPSPPGHAWLGWRLNGHFRIEWARGGFFGLHGGSRGTESESGKSAPDTGKSDGRSMFPLLLLYHEFKRFRL